MVTGEYKNSFTSSDQGGYPILILSHKIRALDPQKGRNGFYHAVIKILDQALTCRALEPTTSDLHEPGFMIRMIMQSPILSPTEPDLGPPLTCMNPVAPDLNPSPSHPEPGRRGPLGPRRAGAQPGRAQNWIKNMPHERTSR